MNATLTGNSVKLSVFFLAESLGAPSLEVATGILDDSGNGLERHSALAGIWKANVLTASANLLDAFELSGKPDRKLNHLRVTPRSTWRRSAYLLTQYLAPNVSPATFYDYARASGIPFREQALELFPNVAKVHPANPFNR